MTESWRSGPTRSSRSVPSPRRSLSLSVAAQLSAVLQALGMERISYCSTGKRIKAQSGPLSRSQACHHYPARLDRCLAEFEFDGSTFRPRFLRASLKWLRFIAEQTAHGAGSPPYYRVPASGHGNIVSRHWQFAPTLYPRRLDHICCGLLAAQAPLIVLHGGPFPQEAFRAFLASLGS